MKGKDKRQNVKGKIKNKSQTPGQRRGGAAAGAGDK